MLRLNLQFFGGRGASSGPNLGSGQDKSVNIKNELDVWSYRHRRTNEPFVDAINQSVRNIQNDFPDIMEFVERVNATTFGGADATGTLGIYSVDAKSVGLNTRYTDIDKMTSIYEASVKSGFHPGLGNKNGVEAVTLHEMGHAITGMIWQKNPGTFGSFDSVAEEIVDTAYRRYSVDKSRGKTGNLKMGTKAWAKKISGYATDSNSEAVAEAVADYYCNGSKAAEPSKYIVDAIKFWNTDNRGAIPFN